MEDSELVNQKLDKKLSDMSALQREYSLLDADLPIIYSAIPEKPDVAKLLGQIQAIATEKNVTIIDMQSFPVPIREGPKKLKSKENPSFDFSVEVGGTYNDLQSFLQELTSFERIITITAVSIGRDSEREGSPLEMTIKGKAYYQYES